MPDFCYTCSQHNKRACTDSQPLIPARTRALDWGPKKKPQKPYLNCNHSKQRKWRLAQLPVVRTTRRQTENGGARAVAVPKTWQSVWRGGEGQRERERGSASCWSTRAFYNSWRIRFSGIFVNAVSHCNSLATPTSTASAPRLDTFKCNFLVMRNYVILARTRNIQPEQQQQQQQQWVRKRVGQSR